jgi:hypothetical protein
MKIISWKKQLLRSYFEPNEDERQRGVKTPTKAHKAIARLVEAGYIKVIITTNFDRLMEKALEDVGVIPTIISTSDTVQGAMPITHTRCTLIKVHGDYLDTRIKNTPEELSKYDKRLNALLDRVLDEFGLIICGWSGDWDIALRGAIFREKSHRFTTYWTVKDSLSETAQQLASHRRAEIVEILTADSFFSELSEKVLAIDDYSQPHPLSAKLAVVTLKKYLEEKNEIRIHDLILHEADNINKTIILDKSPTESIYPTQEEFLRRLHIYESKVESLQAMMGYLGYWGTHNAESIIELLVESQKERGGYDIWRHLRLYPALISLYSLGLAALANANYSILASTLLKPLNKHGDSEYTPLIMDLFANFVISTDNGHWIPGHENKRTPTSDYLFEFLRPNLRELIPEDKQYGDVFDYFEYFQSLVTIDLYLQNGKDHWIPIGRFGWKNRDYGKHISTKISDEIEAEKSNWKPLTLGFFGNSFDRIKAAQEKLIERVNKINWY